MKFDTSSLPKSVLSNAIEIGDVYPAKGGAGTTRFWLVVAMNGKTLHTLGINGDGEVVSTSSYAAHSLEGRPRVGRVDLAPLFMPIISEVQDP